MSTTSNAVQASATFAQGEARAGMLEKVLLNGDLSKLSAAERLQYYNSVCQSLGLNPLTRPFDYITLNGKLTLYARRECKEQLRKLHNISVTIVAREVVEGCYVVTARATMPSGRCDESIGAVQIEGLKGEIRSNAMMKAETKAKSRVTLSIAGLGMSDESETDYIPGSRRVVVDESGAIQGVDGGTWADGKAAASAVAEEKLRKMKQGASYQEASVPVQEALVAESVEEAKAAINPPFKYAKMLAAFADKKKDLIEKFGDDGKEAYYRVLGLRGWLHANEIRSESEAKTCFRELKEVESDLEAAMIK